MIDPRDVALVKDEKIKTCIQTDSKDFMLVKSSVALYLYEFGAVFQMGRFNGVLVESTKDSAIDSGQE